MQDERPNILFVHTDQQRPEWVEMNPDIPVRFSGSAPLSTSTLLIELSGLCRKMNRLF